MLYRPIYSATDYHLLQMNIDNLCVWSDNNLLKFNARKCKHMIISGRKQPSLHVRPLYTNMYREGTVLQVSWSLAYFHPQLIYANQQSMQKSNACNKWVFYTESSIPLQTLHHSCNCTWLIHPPTSGVCSTCMGSLPTGTYQLPGDRYWKRSVLRDRKGLAWRDYTIETYPDL